MSVLVLPAASRAVTVITLLPDCSVMLLADQDVVPLALPLPPRLFDQLTCVTPTLSEAVPLRVSGDDVAVCVALHWSGPVIVTAGLLSCPACK